MNMTEKIHHQIVIVGGGTAGITVAARLKRADASLDVALIEPSDKHYYQPLWTLVGAGVFPKETTERPEADYIPQGTSWIRDFVDEVIPEEKKIVTRGGKTITYDYLVMAAGIQIDWHLIPGLKETIGKNGVCSNYAFEYVDYTWECIKSFQGGTALFTVPHTAIKCGGAPQKIMYLAEDFFNQAGVREKSRVIFASPQKAIFSIPKYRKTLEAVIERKKIETMLHHNLVEVRGHAKEAVVENLDTHEKITIKFDMMHVTPPMSPPDFIKKSSLANNNGWVEADRHTLQHPRFPNVFSLGDNSGIPASKTGAAIRKQAPVLVANLIAAMKGEPPSQQYDGYSSCPIITGYGKVMLAEFNYDGDPVETFPFDQSKERYSMYLLKAHFLPWMYWHGMLRGRM